MDQQQHMNEEQLDQALVFLYMLLRPSPALLSGTMFDDRDEGTSD